MNATEMQGMLSIRQLAQFLGVSVRTIRNWMHGTNALPFYRLNASCIRFRLVEVQRWADRQRTKPDDIESIVEEFMTGATRAKHEA